MDPITWDAAELSSYLSSCGLPPEISSCFEYHNISGEVAADLFEADLAELGIAHPLRRRRVFRELQKLFNEQRLIDDKSLETQIPTAFQEPWSCTEPYVEGSSLNQTAAVTSFEPTASYFPASVACPSSPSMGARRNSRLLSPTYSSLRRREMNTSSWKTHFKVVPPPNLPNYLRDSRLARMCLEAKTLERGRSMEDHLEAVEATYMSESDQLMSDFYYEHSMWESRIKASYSRECVKLRGALSAERNRSKTLELGCEAKVRKLSRERDTLKEELRAAHRNQRLREKECHRLKSRLLGFETNCASPKSTMPEERLSPKNAEAKEESREDGQ